MARRKQHEEHENHERWLVSYADFITLLFAFFVVMYAISSVNEGKYRVLSDSLIQAFQNPEGSNSDVHTLQEQSSPGKGKGTGTPVRIVKIKPEDDPRVKETRQQMQTLADDLLKVMKPLIDEGQVKVSQTARGISVEINASVLFPEARADLNPSSTKVLSAVADLLAPEENAIQIEGHTDNKPIHTAQFPSNWELSSARASSVVRLFNERGVAASRLAAIGYAEYRPKVPNDTEDNRAQNRRVQVTILAENREQAASMPAL